MSESKGSTTSEWATHRDRLLEYLATGVAGDLEAAEWVLLHLLSRVHTRRAGLILGSFPINLSFPKGGGETLGNVVSSLLPNVHTMPLTLASLNDPAVTFQPKSDGDNLEAGVLQLPPDTQILVDERSMDEGRLNDKGGCWSARNYPGWH